MAQLGRLPIVYAQYTHRKELSIRMKTNTCCISDAKKVLACNKNRERCGIWEAGINVNLGKNIYLRIFNSDLQL